MIRHKISKLGRPRGSSPISDLAPCPQVSFHSPLEAQFLRSYSSQKMMRKIPNLTNTLASSRVTENVRTQMVDWMFEVLNKLGGPERFNEYTFFRAVQIFDLYIKKDEKQSIGNEDVHLIGITSMFIASKYEDSCPFRLREFTEGAAAGSFSNSQVTDKECEIINSLDLVISLTTVYEVFEAYISRLKPDVLLHIFEQIKNVAFFSLVVATCSSAFNDYEMKHIVLASIFTGMRYLEIELAENNSQNPMDLSLVHNFLRKDLLNEELDQVRRTIKFLKNFLFKFFENTTPSPAIFQFFDFKKKYFSSI